MRSILARAVSVAVAAACLSVSFVAPVAAQEYVGRFTRVLLDGACLVRTGTGSPEGAVLGKPCDVYLRSDGGAGTTVYRKESGVATNTGWIATPTIPVPATQGGTGQTVYTIGEVLYADTTTTLARRALLVPGTGNAALAWASATTVDLVERDTGADPSADDPVVLTIGGQERIVTAAQAVVLPTDLDTGSEAAGTTYYVWATRDGLDTGIALKLSASKTAPTGLTTKLLLGAVHNNPSSNLIERSVWSLSRGERDKDGMVKVGDLWVDIYEASVWTTPSGGTQKGASSDDYGCDDTGNNCSGLYARSVYNVTPSRYLSWFQAARFCAASAKHLIRDADWQTQALGTPDNSTDCNIATAAPEGAGTRTGCVSWAGTYDNVGNLWEWTGNWWAGTRADASPAAETPETSTTWGPGLIDTLWNIRGAAYADGNGSGYKDNMPAAGIRGGNWDGGAIAGVFSLNLLHSPWDASSSIGFRCAGR